MHRETCPRRESKAPAKCRTKFSPVISVSHSISTFDFIPVPPCPRTTPPPQLATTMGGSLTSVAEANRMPAITLKLPVDTSDPAFSGAVILRASLPVVVEPPLKESRVLVVGSMPVRRSDSVTACGSRPGCKSA